MTAARDWSDASNVLCVRLDALGDVIMTSPALRALKAACPGRRITLLTSPAGAQAASLIPAVDDVIVYEAPWMKATAPRADSQSDHALIGRLHDARFDAAVIFTVYSQNPLPAAMICMLAEIPLRLAHCRENPYQLLTDWEPDLEPDRLLRHEVRRQLDLVRTIGCQIADERMVLESPPGARMRVLSRLQKWGQPPLGLGCDPSRFHGSLAPVSVGILCTGRARLVLDVGMQVIFTGSVAERIDVERIQAAIGTHSFSLAGELDLGELAACCHGPAVDTNNAGPVHVAAAVGTPVVDLYALTNPQHTPWGVPHRVLNHDVPCKYCYKSVCPEGHHNCLSLVPPEEVVRRSGRY